MSQFNLANIQRTLKQSPQQVRLIAVTKNLEVDKIKELLAAGVDTIGENRVQEAARKFLELKFPCEKHLIGHLQTNKVQQALELFDVIDSVDSLKLAQKISEEARKLGKIIPILLEVNIAGEEQKYGFKVSELENALKEIQGLSSLEVRGLMAMVPFTEDPETSRPYFREMKKLADKFKLPELSLGTSQDWELAVEEGATMVRVGRGLFGNRGQLTVDMGQKTKEP
ncbi:MAG: YggS family pyridoxal phosphate-dependent enzyme [Candidatus Gracilibacteria bacterium]|nr:YggS family pyridoxal phosphate-dependent enzyme [Candidatus Gracilibacteria bacterium]